MSVSLILTQREGRDNKKLLEELEGIRNGSYGSINTASLTLGVGVEAVAKTLLGDVQVEPEKEVTTKIDLLISHLSTWAEDDGLRKRAINSVRSMKGVRTADRIYAFANRNKVDHALVASWKKMRDTTAHGSLEDADQGLHDQYYAALELLYRIIACAIGYSGPISSTSIRGWGLDEWGMPTSASEKDSD